MDDLCVWKCGLWKIELRNVVRNLFFQSFFTQNRLQMKFFRDFGVHFCKQIKQQLTFAATKTPFHGLHFPFF